MLGLRVFSGQGGTECPGTFFPGIHLPRSSASKCELIVDTCCDGDVPPSDVIADVQSPRQVVGQDGQVDLVLDQPVDHRLHLPGLRVFPRNRLWLFVGAPVLLVRVHVIYYSNYT